MKQLLPNDIDSGNKTDSEPGNDVPTIFSIEPILACLDDFDCNNLTENEGERVFNETVAFDYSLCLEDVFRFVDISSLHIPLPTSKRASMHIENNEGSVLIVPPTERDQSPIIFGRSQVQVTTSRESDYNLEPP